MGKLVGAFDKVGSVVNRVYGNIESLGSAGFRPPQSNPAIVLQSQRDNGGAAGVGVRNGQRVSGVTRIRRGGRAPGDRGSGRGGGLRGVVRSVATGVYVGVVMRPAGDRRIRRIRDRHVEGTGRRIAATIRRSGGDRVRSDRKGRCSGSDGGAGGSLELGD